MRLDVFRHLWGMVGPDAPYASVEQALPAVRAAGPRYRGIEHTLLLVSDPVALAESLRRYELDFIPMVLTFGATVREHLDVYRSQLEQARQIPHRLIVSHGGLDAFDEAQAVDFFAAALRIERDLGLEVAHETHRGRILYNPWITARLLDRFEDLKLNCDFSHWVVVCERLIDDQLPILRCCAERALHVHARVGYENGPQVSDPAAPEYRSHLEAHERWWDLIWDAQARRRLAATTLTPEFGPPTYQQTTPWVGTPTSNLVEVCDWMAEREQRRFAERSRDAAAGVS